MNASLRGPKGLTSCNVALQLCMLLLLYFIHIIYTYIDIHITYTYIDRYRSIYVYLYMHVYVYICIYLCVSMYVSMYVCVSIFYVYMHVVIICSSTARIFNVFCKHCYLQRFFNSVATCSII